MHALIATGVNADRKRVILDVDVASAKDGGRSDERGSGAAIITQAGIDDLAACLQDHAPAGICHAILKRPNPHDHER